MYHFVFVFLIYSYHGKILFSAAVMNQECKGSNIFRELVWKEVFFRQRETERVGQTSLSQLSHTCLSVCCSLCLFIIDSCVHVWFLYDFLF